MISKRRRLDDEDDIVIFLGLPPSTSRETDMDELGRTVPQTTTAAMRVSRRAARSHRRLLRRAPNQSQPTEEGDSTDGSLTPASADDFREAIHKLEVRKKDILADVRAEDFRDPQVGLAKWFGEWRAMYEASYVNAWGGLGLVAAWEFWSRLEMVGWDPLEVK